MNTNKTPPKSIQMNDLLKAWVVLVALTLLGYGLSLFSSELLVYVGPLIIAALILFKARIILTRYLGLTRCPAWLSMLSSMIFALTMICAVLLTFVSAGGTQ
ncbi:hypothetical protein [Pseudovibrio ascidiaceicola]|uniref:Prokaryotic Cytochrome C oxidase subunit IV n=1 Tax=Pseudovibrio ascidiaceicola TaxID=285279 RepID=A0A1I4E7W7_9HYPH|nr:hypothetical protein [Pseudovibrio ascidiaceicola]SFL01862.1 hypothetical protein SAMN04488518_11441 [Pseudovibrio ascidiaceicola]